MNLPHVHSVHLKSFSVIDKQATFYVALFNSNDFPIVVSGADGGLTLNQLNIGKFDVNTEYTIVSGGLKTVVIPISLEPDAFLEASQTVLTQSKAQYQIEGNAKTSFGSVPFSNTGDLPIQGIISAIIR